MEGDEFTAQVLMKVRQLDETELIDELTGRLMNIHQLIREGQEKALPNGEYLDEFVFKHNLIRQYMYARLPQAKKRRIHGSIGENLETLYAPETDIQRPSPRLKRFEKPALRIAIMPWAKPCSISAKPTRDSAGSFF
ncbi:predicted ATPase [Candidatus Vecturithrix granuli]|uniref:Predicted ATPase n=1 Tax=Vecturithrix granuli TaxID=1499967 RepID=A0A081C901_VECG1|nr:predicted ATPase [Candidatus Vecturithrix granuli]